MDEWQATDAPPRKIKGPVLTSHTPVRFPPELFDMVKRAAERDGMTPSSWIRQATREKLGLVPGTSNSYFNVTAHYSDGGQADG